YPKPQERAMNNCRPGPKRSCPPSRSGLHPVWPSDKPGEGEHPCRSARSRQETELNLQQAIIFSSPSLSFNFKRKLKRHFTSSKSAVGKRNQKCHHDNTSKI